MIGDKKTIKTERTTSVKLNIVMNFILTMSNFIFPLITFPYVSRVLMPSGNGKVAFATSIVAYFVMFGMLGIPTYGIRAVAKVKNDKDELSKTVQEILIINSIAMGISSLSYLLAIIFVPRLAQDSLLFMLKSATLLFNLIGCEWLYRGLEQYSYITIRSIFFKILSIVAMFVFVKEQGDYIIYGAITMIAGVGSNILNFINLRKLINFKKYENLELKKHLKPIFSFFMMTVATTIYTNLDSVMLGFIKGDEAVGYYNAAVKIKTIMVSLVTSIGAVLLPRLSYYIKEKRLTEFRALTIRSLQFICFIAVPLWIYFTVFAKQGIYFLSGEAYGGSIIPMQLIMPTLLLIGVSNLLGIQILVPQDREIEVVKSVFLGAVVNLLINALVIPKYGASGAAFGTLVAEGVVTAYQIYILKDFLKEIISQVAIYKHLLASVLGVAVAISLKHAIIDLSLFWQLACSATVFALVYGVILLLTREAFIVYLLNFAKVKLEK